MDRDALVRDTYAHYGLAMYQAQVLEHGLVNAMVYARLPESDRITRSEIDDFMSRQFEKTLGALVRELRRYVEVPEDLAANLVEALRLRNHLAHEYFRDRAATFMTNEGCLAMINELEVWRDFFRDVNAWLSDLVSPLRERFGVTDDRVRVEMARMIEDAGTSTWQETDWHHERG